MDAGPKSYSWMTKSKSWNGTRQKIPLQSIEEHLSLEMRSRRPTSVRRVWYALRKFAHCSSSLQDEIFFLLISLFTQERHVTTQPVPLGAGAAGERYGRPVSRGTWELTTHRIVQELERGRCPLRLEMIIPARMEGFR